MGRPVFKTEEVLLKCLAGSTPASSAILPYAIPTESCKSILVEHFKDSCREIAISKSQSGNWHNLADSLTKTLTSEH